MHYVALRDILAATLLRATFTHTIIDRGRHLSRHVQLARGFYGNVEAGIETVMRIGQRKVEERLEELRQWLGSWSEAAARYDGSALPALIPSWPQMVCSGRQGMSRLFHNLCTITRVSCPVRDDILLLKDFSHVQFPSLSVDYSVSMKPFR